MHPVNHTKYISAPQPTKLSSKDNHCPILNMFQLWAVGRPLTSDPLKTTENSGDVQQCQREKSETSSRNSSEKRNRIHNDLAVKRAVNNRLPTPKCAK